MCRRSGKDRRRQFSQVFSEDDWYSAFDISELIDISGPRLDSFERAYDVEEKNWEKWKTAHFPLSDDVIVQRLRSEGVDENTFRQALSLPPSEIKGLHKQKPRWLFELEEAFACKTGSIEKSVSPHKRPTAAFLNLLSPLIAKAKKELNTAVKKKFDQKFLNGSCPMASKKSLRKASS